MVLKLTKHMGMILCIPKFLQLGKEYISEPLAYIINKSLKDSVVPDVTKIARVMPVYRSNDPSLDGNYRPISIQPVLSKIIERLVYIGLQIILIQKNFFTNINLSSVRVIVLNMPS